jgi:hypothetical protein
MVKTSTAEENGYHCPECNDELCQDRAGRGFVRHKTIQDCLCERGLKDIDGSLASDQANAVPHPSRKPPDGHAL